MNEKYLLYLIFTFAIKSEVFSSEEIIIFNNCVNLKIEEIIEKTKIKNTIFSSPRDLVERISSIEIKKNNFKKTNNPILGITLSQYGEVLSVGLCRSTGNELFDKYIIDAYKNVTYRRKPGDFPIFFFTTPFIHQN